jgi:nitroimidazol reductase NimA-like FMN-containing flavoprotein (pyridoxamine 5'-phosphate oxidase superfamily)
MTPLRHEVRTLLEQQVLGVLSTHGPEGPHASLVAFVAGQDLQTIVLATPKTTRKYANLEGDPRVALLVDNRSNQRSDCHTAMAATLYGRAETASPESRPDLLQSYLGKHPHLVDFVQASSCALVVVRVSRISHVRAFQQVSELVFSP